MTRNIARLLAASGIVDAVEVTDDEHAKHYTIAFLDVAHVGNLRLDVGDAAPRSEDDTAWHWAGIEPAWNPAWTAVAGAGLIVALTMFLLV